MQNIYALHDVKAQTFSTPFTLLNDAIAERMFINMVRSDETDVGKNPEDFKLFKIAEYDEHTGEVIPTMELLLDGLSVPRINEKV